MAAAVQGPALAATDTTPPAPFDLLADAGDHQTGYTVASPWNSVNVSWEVTTDNVSSVQYALDVDGVTQRVVAGGTGYPTMSKQVDVPEGYHTVSVTAIDSSGNQTVADHFLDVVVDKESPTFTSNPRLVMRTGRVTPDSIPVRYSWTATDVGTGLQRVRVGYGTTCCFEPDVTATSQDFDVAWHSTANWRIYLYDGVGRTVHKLRSAYITAVPSSKVQRKGDWSKRTVDGALDGTEAVSLSEGDKAIVTVTGHCVAWVTARGPKRGVADVYIDGKLRATVDLKAKSLLPARTVWTQAVSPDRSHRVVIVNRSPKTRRAIGVDTFLLQS